MFTYVASVGTITTVITVTTATIVTTNTTFSRSLWIIMVPVGDRDTCNITGLIYHKKQLSAR